MPRKLSAARRALLWWFDHPANAHVSAMVAIDFTGSRQYLQQLNQRGHKVSIHHLLVAAITRALVEYPVANAKIYGRKIVPKKEVGVAMPVNLLGHAGESKGELTMAVMANLQAMTLVELSEKQRKNIEQERSGKPLNPLIRLLFHMAESAPDTVFWRVLDRLDTLLLDPIIGERVFPFVPITTAITNPGAAVGEVPGMLLRSAAVSLPQKLVHVGTLWGLGIVQDEVIAVDGKPEVRPMLPVVLVFDHRLFDGVMAGRILTFFGKIVQNPAAYFGEDGTRIIGSR